MTPKPAQSGAAPWCLLAAALALALSGCGGGSASRHTSAGGRGSHAGVDPGACGAPAGDLGRRTQTFLQATLALEDELASTDAALHATCAVMARRLGLPGQPARARRTGPRALPLCAAVAAELDARLAAPAAAAPAAPPAAPAATPAAPAAAPPAAPAAAGPVVVRAAPAMCTVRTDVAAQPGLGAELAASMAATCTTPAVEIALGPGADATRLAGALRTLREDLPIALGLRARLAGPLQAAMRTWGRAATDLVAAGPGALRPLGDQATCMFAQLEAAAARLGAMQASLSGQLAAADALAAAVRLQSTDRPALSRR